MSMSSITEGDKVVALPRLHHVVFHRCLIEPNMLDEYEFKSPRCQ